MLQSECMFGHDADVNQSILHGQCSIAGHHCELHPDRHKCFCAHIWLSYIQSVLYQSAKMLKQVFVACSVGVTSEPECTVKELTPVDKFMILASDGVWEFIESQDAVDIVGNCETVEEGCRQVSRDASVMHAVA